MSNTILLAFVYNRKKTATATKPAAVEMRITYQRKQKYLSTGVKLLPKEWRAGHVVGRVDATEVQRTLDIMMMRVRTITNNMTEEGNINIDDIPTLLARIADNQTFIDYCKERAQIRKYGKSVDSQERYDRFLRWFESWGKITYFADVNESNVLAMDRALKEKKLKPYSIWNNYHRFLNSFVIDAQNDGLVQRNPYKHVRINKEKTSAALEKHLTPEEFKRIENLQPTLPHLERVRDLFVFQTYTCLSYTDLASFDVSKATEVNGRKVYVGKRGKTGQEYTFMLLRPAEAILEKYGGVLPIISNVKYNAYLKVLAMMAGISKPVSSHWARHTGATLLLNGDIDMEVVAKILGHSSSKITRQVYAKLLDETVVKAMEGYEENMEK